MTSDAGWEMGHAPSPTRSISFLPGRGGLGEICSVQPLLLHQALESVTPYCLLQRQSPSPTLMVHANHESLPAVPPDPGRVSVTSHRGWDAQESSCPLCWSLNSPVTCSPPRGGRSSPSPGWGSFHCHPKLPGNQHQRTAWHLHRGSMRTSPQFG